MSAALHQEGSTKYYVARRYYKKEKPIVASIWQHWTILCYGKLTVGLGGNKTGRVRMTYC